MAFDTVKVFLLPTEPVYSHIQKLKLQLREKIGNYFYWDYEPHISLIYLKVEPGHLEPLVQAVEKVLTGALPFDISLNKITAPGRGLIFMDVEKSLPLRVLTNSLHQAFKDYLLGEKPQHEDFEKYLRHHITIGNYIKGDNYDKAIKFLASASVPDAFECRKIVVYKEDPETRKNILLKEFAI
jgi:2'-5' RNA ligase